MLVVELFVMFFEVLFLYRELIDAITPWLAQQTSEQLQLGIVGTLALASFGWIGVRGMIWFLFGRFGTPALLGVLARQTVTRDRPAAEIPLPVAGDVWKAPIAALKAQTEWLKRNSGRIRGHHRTGTPAARRRGELCRRRSGRPAPLHFAVQEPGRCPGQHAFVHAGTGTSDSLEAPRGGGCMNAPWTRWAAVVAAVAGGACQPPGDGAAPRR